MFLCCSDKEGMMMVLWYTVVPVTGFWVIGSLKNLAYVNLKGISNKIRLGIPDEKRVMDWVDRIWNRLDFDPILRQLRETN